jgi:hypothetical protein
MGGGRKQPTQQMTYKANTNLMNMFSVLAETDSEEEVPPVSQNVSESEQESSDSESDSVSDEVPASAPAPAPAEAPSPQFRVWKDDSRFSSMKNNVFSSPFSRKKPRRFAKDDEGWTSIQVGTTPTYSPLTQPSESQNDVPQLNLPPAVFPSLLSRGTSGNSAADDVSEEQNAMAWAEKVKQTLERAGQGRSEMKRAAAKSDDAGNLSFFRRSIVLDEKF